MPVSDNFGLNSDASPTGRGPVPFDAIGQVPTSVAPYDIRQGNFQGGAIDTVLQSGTNEFQGTGFYSLSTDELTGKRHRRRPRVTLPNLQVEELRRDAVGPDHQGQAVLHGVGRAQHRSAPVGATSVAPVPGLTQAQVDQRHVDRQDRSITTTPAASLTINAQKDEKIVGRIDWNITTGQRLSLSYINAYDSSTVAPEHHTSTTAPSLGLASDAYIAQRTAARRHRPAELGLDRQLLDRSALHLQELTRVGQDPLHGRASPSSASAPTPTSVADGGQRRRTAVGSCGTGIPIVVVRPGHQPPDQPAVLRHLGRLVPGALHDGRASDFKLLAEVVGEPDLQLVPADSAGTYYFDSIADFQNRTRIDVRLCATRYRSTRRTSPPNFKYQQYTFGLRTTGRSPTR